MLTMPILPNNLIANKFCTKKPNSETRKVWTALNYYSIKTYLFSFLSHALMLNLDFNNNYYQFECVVFSLNNAFFKNMHKCQKAVIQNTLSCLLLKNAKKMGDLEQKQENGSSTERTGVSWTAVGMFVYLKVQKSKQYS